MKTFYFLLKGKDINLYYFLNTKLRFKNKEGGKL